MKGRVLAVDPGLANTGVVLFVDGKVLAVQTIRTDGHGHKTDFIHAIARCQAIAVDLSIAIERAKPDKVVCESYKDIPGRLRKAANRWTTPLLIGYLTAAVFEDWAVSGVETVFQDPELVMKTMRQQVAFWETHRSGIVPGDQHLTNEHLRSAGAHGLFYLTQQRLKGAWAQ